MKLAHRRSKGGILTDAVVTQVQQPADTSRRKFLVGATTALSTVGAVGVATPFVASWQPSAKAKAAGAPVKVDISKSSQESRFALNGEGSQYLCSVVLQKCLKA